MVVWVRRDGSNNEIQNSNIFLQRGLIFDPFCHVNRTKTQLLHDIRGCMRLYIEEETLLVQVLVQVAETSCGSLGGWDSSQWFPVFEHCGVFFDKVHIKRMPWLMLTLQGDSNVMYHHRQIMFSQGWLWWVDWCATCLEQHSTLHGWRLFKNIFNDFLYGSI